MAYLRRCLQELRAKAIGLDDSVVSAPWTLTGLHSMELIPPPALSGEWCKGRAQPTINTIKEERAPMLIKPFGTDSPCH